MRKHLNLKNFIGLALCTMTSIFIGGCDWGGGGGSGDDNNNGGGGTNGTLSVTSVALGANSCTLSGASSGSPATFPSNSGLRDYYPTCSSNFITLQVNVTGSTISNYEWRITTQTNVTAAFVGSGLTRFTNSVNAATVVFVFASALTQTTPLFVRVDAVDTNNLFVSAFFQINFMGTLSSTNTESQLLISDGFRPHLSPDGTRVVFNRLSDFTASPHSQVWIVNVDGSGLKKLTNPSTSSDYWPQWSPNGTNIVFLRKNGSYDTNTLGTLFSISPGGSNMTEYPTYTNIRDFCFLVRAGATNILADYNNVGIFGSVAAWPSPTTFQDFHVSGTQMRSQAEVPATFLENSVFFDPNGQSGARTFLLQAGANAIPINNGGNFPWPCLSPTGQKIIGGASGGLFANGIWKMGLGGETPVAIASGKVAFTETSYHQPTWSKSTVLYVRFPSGNPIERGDIFLLNGVTE